MLAEKYYFIVNTNSQSGKAKAIWDELESILQAKGIDYEAYITQYYGHATELAATLTESEEERFLVVCGGDGTINEVLNGIRDLSKVIFGYIPLGSANDFARGLKLTAQPKDILESILSAETCDAIDLGEVSYPSGSRRFVISAGVGVDALVCRRALTSKLKVFLNRFHLGSLTYALLTISSLFQSPFLKGTVTTAEGEIIPVKNLIYAAGMNFPYEGGGVPMAPRADATDGKLSVCCVSDIPKLFCLFCFIRLLAGKHEGIKGFRIINTEEVHIQLDTPLVVHADGEDCGDQSNLTFHCLHLALRMPKLG